MGEDNLMSLHKWKNVDVIAERYAIYVYPRKMDSSPQSVTFQEHVVKVGAPIIEISSSLIRSAIKAGKNVQPMLPKAVWVYLDEMNFYK
jgi:nicotinate-nucleotide adenylyltransferase